MKKSHHAYLAIPVNPAYMTYVSWDEGRNSFQAKVYSTDKIRRPSEGENVHQQIGEVKSLPDFETKINEYARLDDNLCYLLVRDKFRSENHMNHEQ